MATKSYSSGGNSPLHYKQDKAQQQLEDIAKTLFCQPYEVRNNLTKDLALKYCFKFKHSDVYKKAKEVGLHNRLMNYVHENALVQADAIIYSQYPRLNAQGVEVTQESYPYTWKAAPHIPYSSKSDITRFLNVLRKAAIVGGINVPIDNDIKKAVKKFATDTCNFKLYEV